MRKGQSTDHMNPTPKQVKGASSQKDGTFRPAAENNDYKKAIPHGEPVRRK